MRLQNKVAIITGASSGLGQAIADMFISQGAKVVLSDINENHNHTINDNVVFYKTDVSKKEDVEKLIDFAISRFHRLDILVNNAGIGAMSDISNITDEEWNKVLSINLNGVFYGIRYASKYMKENNIKGSIINISSILGKVGFRSASAYCVSKGGVDQLTRAIALELAHLGIRVNSIAPGFIKTQMTKGVQENKELNDFIVGNIPMGYMGEPLDIAYTALYLASDESKYITGSVIYVDGGYTAQ